MFERSVMGSYIRAVFAAYHRGVDLLPPVPQDAPPLPIIYLCPPTPPPPPPPALLAPAMAAQAGEMGFGADSEEEDEDEED